MCGFLCNGTREDKQTDVGKTSRKRQPPEYGRLSCPIDALSSFGALEYFKGKDGKRVRAPGGERDKAHARTGAVQVAFVGGGVLPRIGKAGARQTLRAGA